eukprot:SAG31_NODE_12970_length_903_cov_1.111940_2_plen_85_part_00
MYMQIVLYNGAHGHREMVLEFDEDCSCSGTSLAVQSSVDGAAQQSRSRFTGLSFEALTAAQEDILLKLVEEGQAASPPLFACAL